MSTKRSASKASGASSSSSSSGSSAISPVWTALLILGALAYGLRLLVLNGRVTWPPDQLLASLGTVAGCLALIGPILLFRKSGEGGVGELTWLAGGLLIWVFDIAGLSKGDWRSLPWATPLGPQAMGLTILALMVAGWSRRTGASGWRWTNVVGWSLGLFWVASAFISMAPTRSLLLSVR